MAKPRMRHPARLGMLRTEGRGVDVAGYLNDKHCCNMYVLAGSWPCMVLLGLTMVLLTVLVALCGTASLLAYAVLGPLLCLFLIAAKVFLTSFHHIQPIPLHRDHLRAIYLAKNAAGQLVDPSASEFGVRKAITDDGKAPERASLYFDAWRRQIQPQSPLPSVSGGLESPPGRLETAFMQRLRNEERAVPVVGYGQEEGRSRGRGSCFRRLCQRRLRVYPTGAGPLSAAQVINYILEADSISDPAVLIARRHAYLNSIFIV